MIPNVGLPRPRRSLRSCRCLQKHDRAFRRLTLRSSGGGRSRSRPADTMAREITPGSARARRRCRGARCERGRQSRLSRTRRIWRGEARQHGTFIPGRTTSRLTKKPAADVSGAGSCKSCDVAFMEVICPTCQWCCFELTAHIDGHRPSRPLLLTRPSGRSAVSSAPSRPAERTGTECWTGSASAIAPWFTLGRIDRQDLRP